MNRICHRRPGRRTTRAGEGGPSDAYEKRDLVFEEIGIDGIAGGQIIAELPLQRGAYVLGALADLQRAAGKNPGATSCSVSASFDSDDAQVSLGTQAGQISQASLQMALGQTLDAPTTAQLV